ncbi:thioesterase family protein [Dipodascopsis tothii]|uniref:thioesterase family protein n=1 Tax=Dipodascopsis tothii TaxID=44089 RepID=UPI0034D01060
MSSSNAKAAAETLELPTDADDVGVIAADTELSAEDQQKVASVVTYIDSLPLTKELRADPNYKESRPHLTVPAEHKPVMLTAGSLAGPGRITVPPYVWTDDKNYSLVAINHLGPNLCGHPGIVHGGLLSTLLDEGLTRCAFAALPSKVGVTASLNINYKAPVPADSYVVMRAHVTKAEGRKAYVKGHLESVPKPGQEPVVFVEAECLAIEPKWAAGLKRVVDV